jgi:hypothetical protein
MLCSVNVPVSLHLQCEVQRRVKYVLQTSAKRTVPKQMCNIVFCVLCFSVIVPWPCA